MRITLWVPGFPATKGSAKAWVVKRAGGKPHAVITNDAGAKAKDWAARITFAARKAMKGAAPMSRPVRITISFYLPRPKAHYRANGDLRPEAPTHVATRPDGDKLERCSWDALSGVVFADDALIVAWSGAKFYANDNRVGAHFEIEAAP